MVSSGKECNADEKTAGHITSVYCYGFFAQQVTVSTDTTTYLIGDYIRVQLQADAPAGTTITFPQADLMDPELEVISVNPPDSIPGSTGIRQEMVFSVYDSGTYRVPQLPFVFTSKNSTDTIYSDSLLFRVNTLEVDTTAAIKPIKDNLEVSYRDLRWLYYAGGGLLLLVIAAATIWYLRKRKQQKQQLRSFCVLNCQPIHWNNCSNWMQNNSGNKDRSRAIIPD